MRDELHREDGSPAVSGLVDLERGRFAAASRKPEDDPRVTGVFAECEFELARSSMVDLDARQDYADWLDLREGAQMALSLAGESTATVMIEARPFLRWCALTGCLPSGDSLDRFATLAWALQNAREISVFARVSRSDFSKYSEQILAFRGADDFPGWERRRSNARARAAGAGSRVEEMPVRIADFAEWCDCVGLAISEHVLDEYASLLVEELASAAIAPSVNQFS
jgi:hypothetical protein